jgi:RNA polymerase sigma-70 factor, ECF subfamily
MRRSHSAERVLCELIPVEAENIGLLALMLLQHSRRDARVVSGELITLEEQDRSRWDRGAISEGSILIEKALSLGPVGPYQLQAAIAALHTQAVTSEDTDWPQIVALYEKLLERNPSPVIALNRAVAVAMSGRLENGLEGIDDLGRTGVLDQYYLFHAARADLLRRLNRCGEAVQAYKKAASLATNNIEVEFLRRRLHQMEATR